MSNEYNRIRIAGDLANPFADLINAVTTLTPEIPRGRHVRIDVAVFDALTFQSNIAQIDTMTLEIKAASRTGAPIISKTISSFAPNVSHQAWLNGTQEHASFQLTDSDTNGINMGGELSLQLWLVITATTTGGKGLTVAAGPVLAIEDGGVISGNTPTAGDPTYYTKEQIDAKLLALFKSGLFPSENGTFSLRIGVTDDGEEIHDIIQN